MKNKEPATSKFNSVLPELIAKESVAEDKVENTREFLEWSQIMGRCHNPHHPEYVSFGGSGIEVCRKWRASFKNFLQDMGRIPSKHCVLIRIDENEDFRESNCAWDYPPSYIEYLRQSASIHTRVEFPEKKELETASITAIESTSQFISPQAASHPSPTSEAPLPINPWASSSRVSPARETSQEELRITPRSQSKIRCPRCTIM